MNLVALVLTWILIVAIVAALIYVFRPSSAIYQVKFSLAQRVQRAIIAGVLVFQCASIVVVGSLNDQQRLVDQGTFWDPTLVHVKDENQYNHLADALLQGHAYLDLPVSDILLTLDNPYDTAARMQANEGAEDPIYWDYAYYDGHYYSYFGIVPVLLTYLPFKAITGLDLSTVVATMLFCMALCCATCFVLKKLADCYFPNLNLGAFILAMLACFAGFGVFEQIYLPRIYSVAMVSALLFVVLGLGFWLSFKNGGKKRYLWLGGFSLALTLGCRPIFVLSALLAFPLFWREITREREFFSRKGLHNTLAVILPFILIALPLMYYNDIRFDSPFDFGATYNLTGSDMNARDLTKRQFLFGILEYLFSPLVIGGEFPSISTLNSALVPQGMYDYLTNEPFYGGYFVFFPVSFCGFYALFSRKMREAYHLQAFSWVCAFVALAIVIVDMRVSGVTMRYFSDFGWLITLPTVFALWHILASDRVRRHAFVAGLFVALIFLSYALYGWSYLGVERFDAITYTNPALFDFARHLLLQ